MNIIVAGGGISGLGAAKGRLEAGDNVTIIDQNNSVGGLSRSIRMKDFVFDYTGHLFHLNRATSLTEISPHLNPDEWSSQKRHSGALWGDDLIDAPFQYNLHQLPISDQEIFRKSYLETKKNPRKIHTFIDYLVQNFGEELANKFLIPYNTKILGTDLRRINHNAVTRFFPAPNENLLLGDKTVEIKTYNTNFYYPRKNGIGILIEALVSDLQKYDNLTVVTGNKIQYIDTKRHILYTDKNKYTYDVIISSLPLNRMPAIVGKNKLFNKEALSASKVFSINIGYREPLRVFGKYHWIYFPSNDIPMYRIGFYSKFNEYMAPPGMESAYIECGFDEGDSVNVQKQFNMILDCLENRFGFNKNSVEIMAFNFINPAFVHYTHERLDAVERITNELKKEDIFQVGRYGLWHYCSMEDSYFSGYMCSLD